MRQNHIPWDNTGVHSQNWPDFVLENGQHLEFKAFDATAAPNFDLANFDAYIRSLLTHSERLDTNHLIFAYRLTGNSVEIVDFWLKKIWQMSGPSNTNILSLQVKQNIPVNIRPKNWRSPRIELFATRREFVVALNEALQRFYPNRYPDWFNNVCMDYYQKTEQVL